MYSYNEVLEYYKSINNQTIRYSLLASLNGKITYNKRSTNIFNNILDKKILFTLRALSDIIVVGKRTFLLEPLTYSKYDNILLKYRIENKNTYYPILAIICQSIDNNTITQINRLNNIQILLFSLDNPLNDIKLSSNIKIFLLQNKYTYISDIINILLSFNNTKNNILIEGGSWIFNQFIKYINELCITIAPVLIPTKEINFININNLLNQQYKMHHYLTDNQCVYIRYIIN